MNSVVSRFVNCSRESFAPRFRREIESSPFLDEPRRERDGLGKENNFILITALLCFSATSERILCIPRATKSGKRGTFNEHFTSNRSLRTLPAKRPLLELEWKLTKKNNPSMQRQLKMGCIDDLYNESQMFHGSTTVKQGKSTGEDGEAKRIYWFDSFVAIAFE